MPGGLLAPRPRWRGWILRICAEYADTWNSSGAIAEMRERNTILDAHCAGIGRDPRAVRRSWYGWASKMEAPGMPDPWSSVGAFDDVVGRYREAGVEEFIIDHPRPEQFPVLKAPVGDVLRRL